MTSYYQFYTIIIIVVVVVVVVVVTLDKVQRRGWQLPNICYIYGRIEETIHHLLLHCPIVSALWEIILNLVDVCWVFPKMVKEAITSWRGLSMGKKKKKTAHSVLLCIFWSHLEGEELYSV